MIKNYCLALLYYVALLSAVYGVVTVGTWGYNLVNQTFETRGAISRVDFEGYSCFVGKGKMECLKMINKLQKLKLEMLITNYSHAVSRFDNTPNEYSERQALYYYQKLNEFIDSITEKELKND